MKTVNLVNDSAPAVISKLAEKWLSQGKSFYLGPENIFCFGNSPVYYPGAEEVSREIGSWSVHTSDMPLPVKFYLSKQEISEISDAFRQVSAPTGATLYLSDRCNAKCFMCPYHGEETEIYDTKFKSYHNKVVPLDVAKKWVDKLVEIGVKNVSIASNGETLMLPYWEELMRYTAQKGLTQFFITNGLGLTEEVAQKLGEIGNITCAEVSLHATDYETWSSVVGIKNKKLYENAVNSPLLLKKYGIDNVVVAFVKSERNIHNLKTFLDYWVSKVSLVTVLHRLYNHDEATLSKINDPYNLCSGYASSLYISPSGDIIPCCGSYLYINDENKENIGIININDNSSSEVLDYWRSLSHNDAFKNICMQCWGYQRFNTKSEEVSIYGHKAVREDMHYRVFGVPAKKKKTIKDRIRNEFMSMKRHIREGISKK